MPGRPPSSHFSAVISIDSNSCWRSPSASAWQSRNLVASSIHNKWTTWHAFYVFPRIMLYNVIYIYIHTYVCIYIYMYSPSGSPEIKCHVSRFLVCSAQLGIRTAATHPRCGCAGCAQHSQTEAGRLCEKKYLWLFQNSYWKWPFIVSFPINSTVIFHSYVNDCERLPEGNL